VLAAGGPATAVSAALITDLGERVARLHMGSVGWARRWGRTFSIAALLGIIVCGPLLVLPVPTRTFSEAGSSVTRELTLPVDVEVATLAGVAELLELVAEQEGSEYLRAVAASFAELAERLGANSVTDAEADRTARELAEHLRAASRDAGGDFARVVEEAFSRPALTASPAAEAPTAEEPVEAPRTSDGAHE